MFCFQFMSYRKGALTPFMFLGIWGKKRRKWGDEEGSPDERQYAKRAGVKIDFITATEQLICDSVK